MLYIIYEQTFSGYNELSLDIIDIISIVLGIFVIISKNPIISVLFLIGLFLSISCYLIFTGLNFIGLSYLLVYIGAVSILFFSIALILSLFGIKLIEYFDLENKFPKIAKYIRLRNKLQYYSIFIYIVLMYALLFGIILLNIIILLP